MKDKAGKLQSRGHLGFAHYMADQVVLLNAQQEDGKRHSGIQFVDEPDTAMSEITGAPTLPPAQREARLNQLFSKDQPEQRLYRGRGADRSAAQLKDPRGRDGILMALSADGNPSLQFLDDQVKVMAQFTKKAR